MLGNPFAHLVGKVQPPETGVFLFDLHHRAQRVAVVLEATGILHHRVQHALADVSERRMPKIMRESDCLAERGVEPEHSCHRPRQLGHFDSVRQPRTEVVTVVVGEDLSLVLEAAEGARVNDTIAVALEGIPVGVQGLGEAAPARFFCSHRVRL